MCFIYSIHIIQVFLFVCVLTWSLLGSFRGQKSLGHAQMVSFRGLIQNFRQASPPLSYAESPPPGSQPQDACSRNSAFRYHVPPCFAEP